jgi:CRP/FNR family transcriptional regulator, cyclic AMP receptor protein
MDADFFEAEPRGIRPFRRYPFLLHLTKRFGKQENCDWWLLENHLNQYELASLVGTSRVSITQQLGMLRELDIVQGTRGRYRVRIGGVKETLVWEE